MTAVRAIARIALLPIFLLLCGVGLVFAQATATLTGRVRDASGAAVPGVAVTATGAAAGARTVFSDASGQFAIPDLAAGSYDVTTELAGFRATKLLVTLTAASTPIELTIEPAGLAESVIVRGARTSRSLLDTSASVEVFDAQALETRLPTSGTNALLALIPNLTATGTTNLAPTVRGADGTGPAQGADAFFAGTRPRLNIQIDGRPASYNEVVFGDVGLWDVAQVEMFRGSQSTVQGRNAMAGTLVVRTQDPTFTPEAKVRVGLGGFDERQVAAAVSGPLVDGHLAGRFSFDRTTSNSFADGYQSYPEVESPGRYEQLTFRGKLLVQSDASRRFTTLVTVNHSNVQAPQVETVARPFEDHVVSSSAMPVFEPRTTGVVAETRWIANQSVSYEHTLAFTDLRVDRKAEPGDGIATIDGTELVFEPRVRFAGLGQRLQGFGGLYMFRGRQDEFIDLFGGGVFDDRTDTVAGFGEVTVALPQRLTLTLAGRLEREHRRRLGQAGPFAIDFDETYNVFSPKVGLEWKAADGLSVGTMVLRGYNGGGAGFTYDFPFVSYTFEPEFVWTSESYVRTDLRDGTLSFTGNVFYSRYDDMQLPFDLNPDPNIWSYVVRNAGAATTYGAEVGTRWRPASSLNLFANVGLLRARITEYPGSNLEGHRLAQSPAVTTNFGAGYRHRSGFDVNVDVRASSKYFSNVNNDPNGEVGAYALAHLQAGYTVRKTRFFAFVNNLLDSNAPLMIDPGETRADDVASIVRPRRAGIGVTWGF